MQNGIGKDIDTQEKKNLYQLIGDRPQQVSNYKRLAKLMRDDSQFESAAQVLKEGLKAHPDDKTIESHLAKTYYEAGDIASALSAYRKLIKKYPEDYVFYEKLEKICRENDMVDEAVKIYKRISKENKLKERSYQRIHYLLVEKLRDFKRGAKNMLDSIEHFGPDYRRCKNLGRLYGKLGDWKKAATFYKKALEFKKDDADLSSLLGWALVDSGRLEEAETYFKRIRHSFQGMTSLSELYLKLGRLEEAEAQIKSVNRLYPGNSRVQLSSAELHLKRGDAEKARDLAEDALKKAPSYFSFEQTRGHAVLESAYGQLGQSDKAAYHGEIARALKKGPDTYTALITLAEGKIEAGEIDSAEAVLNRILSLYAGNTRALIDQGEIQLLRKEPGTAIHFGEAGLRGANLKYREEILKGHLLLERAYALSRDQANSKRHRELAAKLKG